MKHEDLNTTYLRLCAQKVSIKYTILRSTIYSLYIDNQNNFISHYIGTNDIKYHRDPQITTITQREVIYKESENF